jgi:hypothetical protein
MYEPIRAFIRENWSDQKLAEVYAFNQDGKMNREHNCCCLLGVTFASRLHTGHRTECGGPHFHHYRKARALKGAEQAEYIYMRMPFPKWTLGRIMKAEMRHREKIRQFVLADPTAQELLSTLSNK